MTTYREWVNANRRKFALENYSLREMIALSVAAWQPEWTMHDLKQTLRHWPRALHTSGDPEESANRIGKEKADHFESTVKDMNGTNLETHWRDVADYQKNGETWA